MSILVNKSSKILVQGFTGTEGSFHASQMIEYGTNVVGGVTPGKGGGIHLDRPVFNTVADCVTKTGADVSIIFVPPAFAADAIMESAEAGIALLVCIGGGMEAEAARWIKANGNKKPVVGFIAGQTAPPGRRMGHAGAIIGGTDDTAAAKMKIMSECGIQVVQSPADIGKTMANVMKM